MICSSQRNQDDSYVLARLFLSRLVRESGVGVRLFFPLSFAACLAFACLWAGVAIVTWLASPAFLNLIIQDEASSVSVWSHHCLPFSCQVCLVCQKYRG